MLCLCAAQLKSWFQTYLGRETLASYYRQGRQLLLTFLTLVTRWSRPTSNFYALIGQNLTGVHAGNLCNILKLVLLWQLKLVDFFVNRCTRNEIQLLSRVFCYSWLVCLLGFWLRNTSLVKVGNPISDGIVFVFHLAWRVRGLKSLKRFWPYLIVFSASRMVSLSNYCIWCLFFISNLMKSSVVYAAI